MEGIGSTYFQNLPDPVY